MSTTITQAIFDTFDMFETAWTGLGLSADNVKYQNKPPKVELPPSTPVAWAKVFINHQLGRVRTIGGECTENNAILTIQIFWPSGIGLETIMRDSKIIAEAYIAKTSPNGVRYRRVTPKEVGEDGEFFQVNVTAAMEYDEG